MKKMTSQTREANNSLVSLQTECSERPNLPAPLMQNECDPACWFTDNGGSEPREQRDGKSLPAANSIPTLDLIPMKTYQIGLEKKKKRPKEDLNPLSKASKFRAFKPVHLSFPVLVKGYCPLGQHGPWSQSLSLLMIIQLKGCTGATGPLKHLLGCCHVEIHLAYLACGPMVSMMRLEWSLPGPGSGQTIMEVNFQVELTLGYS